MNTVQKYIVSRLLARFPQDEAQALSWWVLEELTGKSKTQLLCDTAMSAPDGLDDIITRLLQGEPVQYIFSHTLWRGLDLSMSPATLIPRPETAELIDIILRDTEQLKQHELRVTDVGTGSGCIALALKQVRPRWQVTGIDVSAEAVKIASHNAWKNSLDVDFAVSDVLSCSLPPTDIIVSNPPYIKEVQKTGMSASVVDYEPHTALFVPDCDPLLFYRTIARQKAASLLYFEINEDLGSETVDMLVSENYTTINLIKDSYGKDRFVVARLP